MFGDLVTLVRTLIAVNQARLVPAITLTRPGVSWELTLPRRARRARSNTLAKPVGEEVEVAMHDGIALCRVSARARTPSCRGVGLVLLAADISNAGRQVDDVYAWWNVYRMAARSPTRCSHTKSMPFIAVRRHPLDESVAQ